MDLHVDTGLLRAAADAVTAAADGLFAAPCVVVRLSADAFGTSAIGYQAANLLQRRAHQAAAVPPAVHGQATTFGLALSTCAAVFEQLEAGAGS